MVRKYVFWSLRQTQGEKLLWLECGLSTIFLHNDRDIDTERQAYRQTEIETETQRERGRKGERERERER